MLFLWVLSFVSQIQGEHRLVVLENKALRILLGPERDGSWRRLHKEEFYDLYARRQILLGW